jgi:hypothetical protein
VNSYKRTLREKYPDSWKWVSLSRRVPGWLTDGEANSLFEIARKRTPDRDPVIVELGSWQGKSSLLLAAGLRDKTGARLFCVDPFGDDQSPEYQPKTRLGIEEAFHRNLRRAGVAHVVNAIKGYSDQAVRSWEHAIDVLFIDADHDYDSVRRDFQQWSPFVKPGGIVALHDVSPLWPGPSMVMVESLQPPLYNDLQQVDSLVWAIRSAQAEPTPVSAARSVVTVPMSDYQARLEAIAHLRRETAELNSELRQLTLERAEIENELRDGTAGFVADLMGSRQLCASLRGSLSWRLTAPLRWLLDASRMVYLVMRRGGLGLLQPARYRCLADWLRYRKQVRDSGLFDDQFYLDHNPDVARLGIDPLLHYFVFGHTELRNPHFLFDTKYYLQSNPDISNRGINPLLDYLTKGGYAGRNPNSWFDSSFYLDHSPDLRAEGLNPLAHYLACGIVEGRDPNPWFDTSEYLDNHPYLCRRGHNALVPRLAEFAKAVAGRSVNS